MIFNKYTTEVTPQEFGLVKDAVEKNIGDIADNADDIATNTTAIATNTADIATNTAAIAKMNGKIELIDTITLTEANPGAWEISKTPDDKPYDFSALYVHVIPAATTTVGYIYAGEKAVNNNAGYLYHGSTTYDGEKGFKAFWHIEKGVILSEGYYGTIDNGASAVNSMSHMGKPALQAMDKIDFFKFSFGSASSIPAGTVIKIYGCWR